MRTIRLERAIDTRGAVAINVITMVGIGPLITIPLVLAQLGGALALLGWIGGAIVALCDGLVWSELASRYPSSGGTYVYLREAFGRDRAGRALAFLFNWQFLLAAPCLLASGYIGFAQYAAFLAPALAAWWPQHVCALAVGALTTALLLRRTASVSATGLLLGAVAVVTLALVAIAALTHASWHTAMHVPAASRFGAGLLAGFGGALYITLYDYVGYADVALLGDEVRDPVRTIPRSIVLSVVVVAALYVALQLGVLGVFPNTTSDFVGSLVVQHAWGRLAAEIVTALVLVTAFASVYGNLLGFSRIPFAAARDGDFLPAFARLHPTRDIPHVAVLAVGVFSLVASFFSLGQVIAFLTAGIVLVQSVMQILALAVLRRSGPAPFAMPLYPLPAIVALGGWLWAFFSTGAQAIAVGAGWLVLGAVVFLFFARNRRLWPFVAAAAALAISLASPRPALAQPAGAWRTWNASRIVQMNGYPVFEVRGKPFFVYGAAYFYDRSGSRMPDVELREYLSSLHVNTIDLYIPWNWQTLYDPALSRQRHSDPLAGVYDWTGATDRRRDLLAVLRTIHRLGLKIVLRPGPVIRNEWRNGGYPSWLLELPAYDMPLHDVLEGRYPATATLQNRHADAAAQEWLDNPIHRHYAAGWLRAVLSVVAPYSHDVIAIALDDDQGAYLDNDTWPAPHWHAYVAWLESTVRKTVGARVPVFVNTYEMKVTADSPTWAWGDWYQSDAYSIGAHDREQIDFSTDLLATQPSVPTMIAEFQAGWLQAADENAPRPADPTNTALALNQMLADGVHGIVNFPVEDTIYPQGWQVPWASGHYAWDAAFGYGMVPAPRFAPTARFGALTAHWGALLASTHRLVDAAIIWPESLFEPNSPSASGAYADAVTAMLAECTARRLSCSLVDLRYAPLSAVLRYRALVMPVVLSNAQRRDVAPVVARRLRLLSHLGRIVSDPSRVRPHPVLAGDRRATLLMGDDGSYAFLDVANWSNEPETFGPFVVRLEGRTYSIRSVLVPARAADLIPVAVARYAPPASAGTMRRGLGRRTSYQPSLPHARIEYNGVDSYAFLGDGYVNMDFQPNAGAQASDINGLGDVSAVASSIGLLRDAVDPEPTPSARDYIAQFTHPMPAGTFNRHYDCRIAQNADAQAVVRCSYDAPDLPDGGALFQRTLTLDRGSDEIVIHETMTPHRADSPALLKSISGFPTQSTAPRPVQYVVLAESGAHCFGVYRPRQERTGAVVVRLCWRPEDVASDEMRETRGAAILTLHFKRNDVEMRLGVLPVDSEAQARALVQSGGPPGA